MFVIANYKGYHGLFPIQECIQDVPTTQAHRGWMQVFCVVCVCVCERERERERERVDARARA